MTVTVYPSRDFSARPRASHTLLDGRSAIDGGYRDVIRVTGAAASVSLLAFPDVSLGLSEIVA